MGCEAVSEGSPAGHYVSDCICDPFVAGYFPGGDVLGSLQVPLDKQFGQVSGGWVQDSLEVCVEDSIQELE